MGSFRIFPFRTVVMVSQSIFSPGATVFGMDFTQLLANHLDTPLYQQWQADDMSYKWIFMKIQGIFD